MSGAEQAGTGSGRAAGENRLARETSPYLLQHARNPVDWRPWGPEAFEAARRRDVPIFLSIGYSTCYWCHVMERESFENPAIAALMNDRFVCVKVDREERPDVDDIYMAAVQAFSGRGGWPMSVFLVPGTLKPYWAGTYFPPEPRYDMPSFPQVLEGMSGAWRTQRDEVVAQSESLAEVVAHQLAERAEVRPIGIGEVTQGVTALLKLFDRAHGGFGSAPKFPQPAYLDLLLTARALAGDDDTRTAIDGAVRRTLDKMALGGIFDQVGGGFHRYSVDERWLVPHFEKMLYDNGQLAEVYAAAARLYQDDLYERTVRRTLDYVLREMTSPEGAFYSAQDAEVNQREGQNYLWTRQGVLDVFGAEDGALACRLYGLDAGPNFRDPHHPEDEPANVLFLADRPEHAAAQAGMTPGALIERLDRINAALLQARARRDQPGTDDKILAGWNGMMIAGMAAGGDVLGEPRFLDAAGRAADFVLSAMREEGESGRLLRTSRGGVAKVPAFLEDYAFLAHGLIALARAAHPQGPRYLEEARRLVREADERFGDPASGGYFDTPEGQGDLFVRTRSSYDGAVPSGSAVMLNNLIDLYQETEDEAFLRRAAACMAALSGAVAASPVGSAVSTRGLMRLLTVSPDALAGLFPEAGTPDARQGDETDAPGAGADFTPVEVWAAAEQIQVSEAEPGGVMLQVRIADGYHINAADPGPAAPGLIGLRVHVVNGRGVRAYAEYPPGEPYGEGGELRVHRGLIEVPVVLEREGDWSGTPLLAVTFQACTDRECLPPTTVELDVALERR